VERHLPFPAEAEARQRLLYRLAMELFGTPVSAQINEAFVADTTPAAHLALAELLFRRRGQNAWSGPLTSGPTKFRVLPADPDAAKRPRIAKNPGQYTLRDKATLAVVRRGDGDRIVNEAHISLSSPGDFYELVLPDGYDTWAASWVKGGSVLWVQQAGLLRKIDFTDLAKVEETRFEADQEVEDAPMPADIREALRAALAVSVAAKQRTDAPPPATSAPAAEAPRAE